MGKPGTKMGQRIQYRSQSRAQCTNGGDLAIRALHDKTSAEVFYNRAVFDKGKVRTRRMSR
jgi:hypothetical protein